MPLELLQPFADPISEPGSLAIFSVALFALYGLRRRRGRHEWCGPSRDGMGGDNAPAMAHRLSGI
jgi:hypothetical protein